MRSGRSHQPDAIQHRHLGPGRGGRTESEPSKGPGVVVGPFWPSLDPLITIASPHPHHFCHGDGAISVFVPLILTAAAAVCSRAIVRRGDGPAATLVVADFSLGIDVEPSSSSSWSRRAALLLCPSRRIRH